MKTIYRMLRRNILPLIISAVLFAGSPGIAPSLSAAEDSGHNVEMESAAANAAIADWGAVMNGEKRRDKLSVRPFLDNWTGFLTIKNTGTTFIDHFRVAFTCPMEGSRVISINLVSPSIPNWLWKPFAGDMMSLCTREMDFTIYNGMITMRDASTGEKILVSAFYPSRPMGPEGLAPGENVSIEYTEPYIRCMEAFVYSIATREKMEITTEIVDRENNIMHMMIKEYRLALFKFERIIAAITFKGTGEYASCSLDLSIDDQLCDSVPWIAYEWK